MNKTICHISYHGPFDDRIYWKQLLALKEAGYAVIHIAIGDEEDDFLTKEGIRIISIKNKKLSKNIYLNKLLQLISKNSIRHRILEKALNVRAIIYQYHDLQVNSVVKKIKRFPHKPKVIYDAREAYFMIWKEKKYPNYAFYLLHKLLNYVIAKWELKQALNVDLILTNDFFTFEYYKKKLPQVPSDTIFNYSYFLPNIDALKKEKKFDFIYAGGVTRSRGVFEMVLAMRQLILIHPNATLLIVGPFEDGILKKEISDLICGNNLEANVIIKDPVPFSEIGEYYASSSIGLGLFHKTPNFLTSIPIKLFEYLAFGLPSIFCNYGPPADIIKETNAGLLVDPLNIKKVCAAMTKLLTDKKLYQEMSVNGIKAVKEKYSWNHEKEKFLNLNHELISKSLSNLQNDQIQ